MHVCRQPPKSVAQKGSGFKARSLGSKKGGGGLGLTLPCGLQGLDGLDAFPSCSVSSVLAGVGRFTMWAFVGVTLRSYAKFREAVGPKP